MSPKARVRAAQILVPVAIAIGIASAFLGTWYATVAMVLLIVSQVINYRANRDRVD